MFECAVFGMTRDKLELGGRPFRRTEKVYQAGEKKAIVQIGEKITATFYDIPDRNKQRISIARKISTVELTENYEKFLTAIGYTVLRTNLIEGYNGYAIEMSRIIKNEDLPDATADLFEYYLVKVFVNTENVNEGVEVLNEAFQELNQVIKLTKPMPSIFTS